MRKPYLCINKYIRKKILDEDNPDTASSLNNLAAIYYEQGLYKTALPLYQHALEITKKVWGEEHPDTAHSLHALAAVYYTQ